MMWGCEIGLRSWFSDRPAGERPEWSPLGRGSAGDVGRERVGLVTLLTFRAHESVKSMISSSMVTSPGKCCQPEVSLESIYGKCRNRQENIFSGRTTKLQEIDIYCLDSIYRFSLERKEE